MKASPAARKSAPKSSKWPCSNIDALKVVASGVNKLKRADNAQLVITHYQRLLNYIVPDFVHVLVDGHIVKSGDKKLALELEAKGYDWVSKGEPVSA